MSVPAAASQIKLLDGDVVCSGCRSFDTDMLRPGRHADVRSELATAGRADRGIATKLLNKIIMRREIYGFGASVGSKRCRVE